MSYNILYRRLFVRLPDDTFIALVESGDSNVYDNSVKRSRSWESWSFGTGKMSFTYEEIYAWLKEQWQSALDSARNRLEFHPQDWNGGDEKDEAKHRFGWHAGVALSGRSTEKTTWRAFATFFTTGMDEAIPIGTFVAVFGGFQLAWYEKDQDGRSRYVHSGPVGSFEELEAAWNALRGRLDSTIWVKPRFGLLTGALASAFSPSARGGYAVMCHYLDEEGKPFHGWVKSLVPLAFTDVKGEAYRFSRQFMEGRPLFFDLFRSLAPSLFFATVSWEKAV